MPRLAHREALETGQYWSIKGTIVRVKAMTRELQARAAVEAEVDLVPMVVVVDITDTRSQ